MDACPPPSPVARIRRIHLHCPQSTPSFVLLRLRHPLGGFLDPSRKESQAGNASHGAMKTSFCNGLLSSQPLRSAKLNSKHVNSNNTLQFHIKKLHIWQTHAGMSATPCVYISYHTISHLISVIISCLPSQCVRHSKCLCKYPHLQLCCLTCDTSCVILPPYMSVYH